MIRYAKTKDIAQLLAIEVDSFDDCFTYNQFYNLINRGNGLFFVSYDNDKNIITGYAYVIIRKDSSIARLYSLALVKKYIGQGLGECILEHIQYFLRKKVYHIKSISLEVKTTNRKAITLYNKMGYEKVKTLKNYYGTACHGYKYKKDLYV